MMSPRMGPKVAWGIGGIILGVVLWSTFAFSMKMTDSRPFCASCHIMNEAAVTHKMSTHANLACNDCHAPTGIVSRYIFKAQEGTRDFFGNVAGNSVPIPVSFHTKDVVNANCKACHAMANLNVASMEAKPYCVDCHRSNAHMRQKPISTRMVAND